MNGDTPKKNSFVNYPLLLLSLYILLNIRGYISTFIGFFKSVFQYPLGIVSNFLRFALSFFAVILLVLLVLSLMKKLKNGTRIIGAVIIASEAVELYSTAMIIIRNTSMFGYILESSLVPLLIDIFVSIFVLCSGVLIFKGKTPGKGFTALLWILVYMLAVRSIFSAVQGLRIIDVIEILIYVLLFYHLPNLFNELTVEKTAITKKKIVALVVVAAILLCVFAVSDVIINGTPSGTSSSTCKSCGRSWNAGDSNGNYVNIARTGMCNNCENNYHSLKDFLD